ncbi:hypothetical protein ACFL3J_02510 [Candidatus Omnitrophota bacterium]
MITDTKCREILIDLIKENTKDWAKTPKFDVVYNSLRYGVVATIGKQRQIYVATFRKGELEKYVRGHIFHVEDKIKRSLFQLNARLYGSKRL